MEEAVVMSWRGVEGGRRAAQMGHDAVMTPLSHLYFDMSQILNRDAEEIPVGGYINLEKYIRMNRYGIIGQNRRRSTS